MWFSLLFGFASAIFVPQVLPKRVPNPLYSDKDVNDKIAEYQMSIILVCDSTLPGSERTIDWFVEASLVFHKNSDNFHFVEAFNAQGVLEQYQQEAPTLILAKKGKPWLICPFPQELTSLLFLCDHFFQQKVVHVESVQQLLAHLGHFSFALVCPPDMVNYAMTARFSVVPYIGMIDLFACDAQMFTGLFGGQGQMALFRMEDRAIASFEPSADGLFMTILPVFRRFLRTDVEVENETIVALIDDELNSTGEALLYELGTMFPEMTIGFLQKSLHHYAEQAMLQKIEKKPAFVAFSFQPKSFFPFKYEAVNVETMTDYLHGILNGTIERVFHSEEIPKNQSGLVETLVGRTYTEFLNRNDTDVIIFYYNVDSEATRVARKVFEEAAEILAPRGCRFGIINSALNSALTPFPAMYRHPYIRFYPSNDRTVGIPFMHSFTKNDILRFVVRLGTKDYNIVVPQKKKTELKREVSDLAKIIPSLPSADQTLAGDYFHELWVEVASDPSDGEL